MPNQPRIPLAQPQHGDQPGTWAHKTIAERFARTAGRIFDENDFSPAITARLQALIADIPEAEIRPIQDPGAPDAAAWRQYAAPYLGQNWHQPPWWFTEHYFYRRILEASRYFQAGDGSRVDPFSYQKQMGLEVSRGAIRQLTDLTYPGLPGGPEQVKWLETLLYLDLWGNQADLSLWPAEGGEKPDHTDMEQALSHILVNDAPRVSAYLLAARPHARIDFLIDNAGFELVSDLALSDVILNSEIAARVCLHVKPYPTYVSDAMENDVLAAIEFLRAETHANTRAVGQRLQQAWEQDRLQIKTNWFWTSPLDGWGMPAELKEDLSQSHLVFSKGDAHYRRLLGDRHWPYTTSFSDILAYYPAPVVALRTLKSELVAGLEPGQAEAAGGQDPQWLVDWRWGMVQFSDPSG
ncbi:MAG: damage-control phosphatase ARMT1 family protein [Anaerolineales bacterium]|nr:damage-control phosphatase ARMT1 family protein [Anaerolineales bacterium]